jgi:hypothetical protein
LYALPKDRHGLGNFVLEERYPTVKDSKDLAVD